MTRRTLIVCSALACSAAYVAGGCSPATNRSTTLAGFPAAEAIIPPVESSGVAGTETEASATRSSRGANRDGWERTVFIAPAGEASHRATYARVPSSYSVPPNPRREGVFPTAESSLMVEGDPGAEALQAFAAPFWAAADIIRFPITAVFAPPWTVISGLASYERVPGAADPPATR